MPITGNNLPGGNPLSGMGGYLQLWNWSQGAASPTGSNEAPSGTPKPINFHMIDVAFWRLFIKRAMPANSFSGSRGAVRRRGIIVDWQIQARLWWDYQFTPEYELGSYGINDSLCVKLIIGSSLAWTMNFADYLNQRDWQNINDPTLTNWYPIQPTGHGVLPKTYTGCIPFYIAPLAVLADQTMDDSSLGNEDGIVFCDVVIESDSLIWYITNNLTANDYADYVNALAAEDKIPYCQVGATR